MIRFPTSWPMRAFCLVAAAAMIVQLFFLVEPPIAEPVMQVMWDKTVHFLFFGTIAFFVWIGSRKRWALYIWLLVTAIGAMDEWNQYYTPGRHADVNDWLADGFGAAAALVIAQRLERKQGA